MRPKEIRDGYTLKEIRSALLLRKNGWQDRVSRPPGLHGLIPKYIQTNNLNIYGKKIVRLPVPQVNSFL